MKSTGLYKYDNYNSLSEEQKKQVDLGNAYFFNWYGGRIHIPILSPDAIIPIENKMSKVLFLDGINEAYHIFQGEENSVYAQKVLKEHEDSRWSDGYIGFKDDIDSIAVYEDGVIISLAKRVYGYAEVHLSIDRKNTDIDPGPTVLVKEGLIHCMDIKDKVRLKQSEYLSRYPKELYTYNFYFTGIYKETLDNLIDEKYTAYNQEELESKRKFKFSREGDSLVIETKEKNTTDADFDEEYRIYYNKNVIRFENGETRIGYNNVNMFYETLVLKQLNLKRKNRIIPYDESSLIEHGVDCGGLKLCSSDNTAYYTISGTGLYPHVREMGQRAFGYTTSFCFVRGSDFTLGVDGCETYTCGGEFYIDANLRDYKDNVIKRIEVDTNDNSDLIMYYKGSSDGSVDYNCIRFSRSPYHFCEKNDVTLVLEGVGRANMSGIDNISINTMCKSIHLCYDDSIKKYVSSDGLSYDPGSSITININGYYSNLPEKESSDYYDYHKLQINASGYNLGDDSCGFTCTEIYPGYFSVFKFIHGCTWQKSDLTYVDNAPISIVQPLGEISSRYAKYDLEGIFESNYPTESFYCSFSYEEGAEGRTIRIDPALTSYMRNSVVKGPLYSEEYGFLEIIAENGVANRSYKDEDGGETGYRCDLVFGARENEGYTKFYYTHVYEGDDFLTGINPESCSCALYDYWQVSWPTISFEFRGCENPDHILNNGSGSISGSLNGGSWDYLKIGNVYITDENSKIREVFPYDSSGKVIGELQLSIEGSDNANTIFYRTDEFYRMRGLK